MAKMTTRWKIIYRTDWAAWIYS